MSEIKSQHTEGLLCQNCAHNSKGMGGNKFWLSFVAYLTRMTGFVAKTNTAKPPLLPTITCYCISDAELEVCQKLAKRMRIPHTIVQANSENLPACALTPLKHLEMEMKFAGELTIHFCPNTSEP